MLIHQSLCDIQQFFNLPNVQSFYIMMCFCFFPSFLKLQNHALVGNCENKNLRKSHQFTIIYEEKELKDTDTKQACYVTKIIYHHCSSFSLTQGPHQTVYTISSCLLHRCPTTPKTYMYCKHSKYSHTKLFSASNYQHPKFNNSYLINKNLNNVHA